MHLHLHPDVKQCFPDSESVFDQIMSLKGETYRHQKGRHTQRIALGGKHYFIKHHHGVGWREIIKNLLQGRLPIISAKQEWLALKKLESINIAVPKVLGYGHRGLNPAKRQSFILMEELADTISLEKLCHDWKEKPPTFSFKRRLIEEVAMIARALHQNGINHRDFYICHFLLYQQDLARIKLYLIDLHRAQVRRLTPERWVIKDLAALYFSSAQIRLTRNDLYRFMKTYHRASLRELLTLGKTFWSKVQNRGKGYRDHTS